MATPITRSAHPDALWPGVFEWFGLSYKEVPELWREFFREESSGKHMEIVPEATGFGLAPVKGEGVAYLNDDAREGYKATYTHLTYALGYLVTREEMEDNQYEALSRNRSRALSYSMRQTNEYLHANVLNNAFSGSYLGGDGVSLCSTSHPTRSGNQANRLASDADLAESSLEDMVKIIMAMKNNRGLPITVSPQKLIVPTNEVFNAHRYVNSALRSGTANNDLNAIKYLDIFPQGIMRYRYLSDDDSWFITTDCPSGLTSFNRRAIDFQKDEDFGTENARAKSTFRRSAGWSDWRGITGSGGA